MACLSFSIYIKPIRLYHYLYQYTLKKEQEKAEPMGSLPDRVKREEGEEEAYLATLQLVDHHGLTMALKAAVELDIFNILACAGPNAQLCAGDIASKIPSCADPANAAYRLDRLLRFLSSHAILRCTFSPGNTSAGYALEPLYRYLAKNEAGVSLAPAIFATGHKIWLDSWHCLKDAVLEGIVPFEKANGMKFFEYTAKKDGGFGELFNEYMANNTGLVSGKIIESYKGFAELSELVDVGGGLGTMLRLIISKHPHIKGINFDLPHVISNAPAISGVEHIAGDIFVSIPRGKAILLKYILHDWGDEECLRILKNCYEALPVSGKAIVVEHLLPEFPERSDAGRNVHYLDLCMMVSVHRGRERNEKEFSALAAKAGFTDFKNVCHAMNYHVLELIK